jgi:hypothetical protein
MTAHCPRLRSLRVKYQVINTVKVTPKQNPAATSPTMSDPCKAATRSLLRFEKRATNPNKPGIRAMRGDGFCILPPSAAKRCRNCPATHLYCGSKVASVSPQREIRSDYTTV